MNVSIRLATTSGVIIVSHFINRISADIQQVLVFVCLHLQIVNCIMRKFKPSDRPACDRTWVKKTIKSLRKFFQN